MRIKRITIGNFKNLAETTLDLTRMIALVSTNNYGKSNLLEAIRFGFDFISASPKERNTMMRWRRGIPLSPELAGKEKKSIKMWVRGLYFCVMIWTITKMISLNSMRAIGQICVHL